jgi:CRP-like cAMP-binding protein
MSLASGGTTPMNDTKIFDPFIKKLGRFRSLDETDLVAIRALPATVMTETRASVLVREGAEVMRCCLLLDGYASREKTATNGGRQIVSFHMSGDILDLQHLLLSRADHSVHAVTDLVVAWIPKDDLKALASSRPAVGQALWIDSLIDASVFREWVLNVGRRDARTRIAHMMCEFVVRCQTAGLGSPERFEFPMSQQQIADATGLTPVHVNRMLRELSDAELISRAGRYISILDWHQMQRMAGFSPEYLHAAA